MFSARHLAAPAHEENLRPLLHEKPAHTRNMRRGEGPACSYESRV